MRWWDVEECGTKEPGDSFDGQALICPYCGTLGNFSNRFRARQDPASGIGTGLNTDVWVCLLCGNHVFVIWKHKRRTGEPVTHSYLSAPSQRSDPRAIRTPTEWEWPDSVARSYAEARKGIATEAWDSAASMARKTVQSAIRAIGGVGKNIAGEIDDVVKRGLLPPAMADWAHHVRLVGAAGAHDDEAPCSKEEANEACSFAFHVGQYLFTLPKGIERARARQKER